MSDGTDDEYTTYKMTDMVDVTGPSIVELRIRNDSKVIWVNVDGICRFRACRIEKLDINDDRPLVDRLETLIKQEKGD